MASNVAEMVYSWNRNTSDSVDYEGILQQIESSIELFEEYEPAKVPHLKQYIDRLTEWLSLCTNEHDRKLLFRLAHELFFIGQASLDSLYQAAFNGPIARWLIDQLNLKLDSPTCVDDLRLALSATWFGELTDSMRIGKFYKLNPIPRGDIRPNWWTLFKLGDTKKIDDYITTRRFDRLVLLEDFVGSGSQIDDVVRFVANLKSTPAILVTPIIVCPSGNSVGRQLEVDFPHVRFDPVFVLPDRCCISPVAVSGEPAIHTDIRTLIQSSYSSVRGSKPTQKLYGPYGFSNTGSLAVLYTNCPDNVPPIVHHDSDTWKALFPRAQRS